MKFKIVKRSDKYYYAVKYRYSFWPFWFWDKQINEGGGHSYITFQSFELAHKRIIQLQEEWKKPKWVNI